MDNILTLKGRTAVITGSAKGIGFTTAKKMCANGMNVALVDIDKERVSSATEELKDLDIAKAKAYICDISDQNEIGNTVEKIFEDFGQIDVVVNAAGIMSTTKIPDMTRDEWDRTIDINLTGSFFMIQKVLPYMEKSKYGRIINISSTAGRMGGIENSMAYTASKGGVTLISKGIARQVAKYNITCNAIAPGPTATEMYKTYTPEQVDNLNKSILLGRLANPEEIATVACFLASEECSYMTGAVLDVNGGFWI